MRVFICLSLDGIRLTRQACAKRHESAASAYSSATIRKGKVWSERCSSCPVGAAHMRGETPKLWPDGARLVETSLVPAGTLLRRGRPRRATAVDFG